MALLPRTHRKNPFLSRRLAQAEHRKRQQHDLPRRRKGIARRKPRNEAELHCFTESKFQMFKLPVPKIHFFFCRKERWTLIRHSLHFTRPVDMCGPAGNDPLSQGVADPRSPSGDGSRLRHVQFRMSRRLASIVGLSLVSATDILIYTVDPRDWTTNQINAVWLFGPDTPGHALCRRSPFAFCPLPFCCTRERNLTCVADLCAATSRTLCSDQPYSSRPVLVSVVRRQRDTQPVNRHRGGDLRRPRFFPNQNPSPLFRAPFPPRACLPCQCDVHQCHRMDRGLLFTQGFLLVSTAQSYPGVFSEPSDSEQQRLSLLRCP